MGDRGLSFFDQRCGAIAAELKGSWINRLTLATDFAERMSTIAAKIHCHCVFESAFTT